LAVLDQGQEARLQDEREVPVLRPVGKNRRDIVERRGTRYVVTMRAATRLAAMLSEHDETARGQMFQRLRKLGVIAALDRSGIKPGESFTVGKLSWEWE
jgi:Obg family GTPase CgtA-like protein